MSWYPKKIDISTGESLTEAELEYLDNLTPGTVAASKAVVVSADKDAGDFRNLDAVNIDAGASGTAGTVDVFPTTASKGKIIVQCTDNTTNHNLTITNEALNGAGKTATFPAVTGYVAESTAALTLAEVDVLDDASVGVVVASKAVVASANKDVGDFRNLDCQNLDAGAADGTDGTIDVFPTTAAKGKLTLQCADNTDDHALIITNAPVDTADKTVTVPALTGYAAISTAALTLAEVDVLDAVTPGTVAGSKAVVVTSDKDAGDFRNLDCVNLDAGSDAVAGTVDVFPATTTRGKLVIQCADNTDAHNLILTNAPVDTADKTVTIPALTGYAGISTAALTLAEMDVLDGATAGTQVASKAVVAGADSEVAGLKPCHTETADGTIPAYRLVKGHTDGTLLVGTLGSKRIVGVNLENAEKLNTNALKLGSGYVTVAAAEPITAGDLVKCGDNGRVLQLADADNVDTVIGASAGTEFTNQPANDAVEILSSNAADTAITVTIIGTTQGGHTVVVEDMTTHAVDATTVVTSTKVDWGLILAVKIGAAHAGTITIREASTDLTIVDIATGTLQAGVVAVAAASQGAHGLIPYIKAGGASTKEVGVKYEPATGAAQTYGAAALNGAAAVALPAAANLVTEVYVGDVAAASTATVYTNATEDDEQVTVGHAVTTMTAGGTGTAYIRP